MKKKVLAIVLSAAMCFAITACGDKETSTTPEETTSVEESIVATEDIVAPEEDITEPAESSAEETVEGGESTEEAGESTAAADGDTTAADVELKVEIPEGFSEVSDGMYMAEDGANIIVLTTEAAGEIPSQDAIVEQLKASLGDETEITVDEYETYQVSGYDALRFSASYVMEDIECTQTQCMVFADGKIGMAAFTQQKGGAWADTFEECIAGITME